MKLPADFRKRVLAREWLVGTFLNLGSAMTVEIAGLAGVDGADVLFVGPTDLSYNMGIRDQLESAPFTEALKKVSAAAKKHGKAAGILVHNNALVPKVREMGFTFVALGSDGGAVRAGL